MRRSLALLGTLVVLAALATPAHAARIVGGTVTPAELKGRAAVAMFFHPF